MAQSRPEDKPTYLLYKTTSTIKIDGIADEIAWQGAQVADSFWQSFPTDTVRAQSLTEARVMFDENYLYITAICYDSFPQKRYVVQSLKRDFSYPRNDAFAVYLDPTHDRANGFNFTVSPLNVQREGLITNGGGMGVTTSWDNTWFSAVRNYEDRWVVEIAIPFKSIRYNPQVTTWGLNLTRNDLKRNESSAWSRVPRIFNVSSLSFTGDLKWTEAPPKAGSNISLIPYGRINLRPIKGGQGLPNSQQWGYAVGSDAKIAVTSALNLDLTVNPDFSQADVDELVINLDRFSIFLPEKRYFFQENSDLFATFGFSRIRPFFSRQIGLNRSGLPVPILAGARLSGKLDAKHRIGAMNIQTEGVAESKTPANNYSVLALQRRIGKASNVGIMGVHRQGFAGWKRDKIDYNTVIGGEYNLGTLSGKWTGKAFVLGSLSKDTVQGLAHASWLMYNVRKLQIHWNHEYVSKNFNAEVGFLPRKAYYRLEPSASFYMYPRIKGSLINRHGPQLHGNLYTDHKADTLNDLGITGSYSVELTNTASFRASYTDQYIRLLTPFDPTGRNKYKLPRGGYNYRFGSVDFVTNYRKLLNGSGYINYGGYYTGNRLGTGFTLNYRVQPYVSTALKVDYNYITTGVDSIAPAEVTLIGPRLDITFSRSLFFTAWVQSNTQRQVVNSNIRLQWRFRPMSDLFIVFNQNMRSTDYQTRGLQPQDQALIVKLNWWLNL